MPTDVTIQQYEERGFNAWPALQTVLADGWLLRFAQGHTKRANSVNACSASARLDGIVEFAAPLYRQHGLPLVFRVTPLLPARFDAQLERLDFRLVDPSIVMTGPLEALSAADPAVQISAQATPDWLRGVDHATGVHDSARDTHRAMLAALRLPAGFATLVEDGVPLAYGMAVLERGALGLFEIVTTPQARRRGMARRLCRALLDWGRQRGAGVAYLQVLADNRAALTLYENLGLTTAYPYHYRERA